MEGDQGEATLNTEEQLERLKNKGPPKPMHRRLINFMKCRGVSAFELVNFIMIIFAVISLIMKYSFDAKLNN